MRKLIILGLLIFLNLFVPTVMTFLTVEMVSYINYLSWINALVIFYLILPSKVSSTKFL
jgi:hypothetical protein